MRWFALLLVGSLVAAPVPVYAATCETKVQTCTDVRLGARLCQVTICKDDLGNIVSTDIIILRDAGQPGTPPVKRPPITRAPATQLLQQ